MFGRIKIITKEPAPNRGLRFSDSAERKSGPTAKGAEFYLPVAAGKQGFARR
jgi:hypothetical protein